MKVSSSYTLDELTEHLTQNPEDHLSFLKKMFFRPNLHHNLQIFFLYWKASIPITSSCRFHTQETEMVNV